MAPANGAGTFALQGRSLVQMQPPTALRVSAQEPDGSADLVLGDDVEAPLLALLQALSEAGYRFITPTPATHARVLRQPGRRRARDLRDVFGWNLPFDEAILPPRILDCLRAAGVLEGLGRRRRSRLRVSSLDDRLFLHSAYPTRSENAVFFGPDSYRFARFIGRNLPPDGQAVRRLADIGAGSGVGAITASAWLKDAELVLTDVNPLALRLARINARAAGVSVVALESRGLDGVDDPIDVAIANPPYIIDAQDRAYRDGGGMHGGQVSLDMAAAALDRLAPGGRLLLYTGSAIIAGRDPLGEALADLAAARGCAMDYRELDPDVFGEELSHPAYADVERIALVGAVVIRPR